MSGNANHRPSVDTVPRWLAAMVCGVAVAEEEAVHAVWDYSDSQDC